MKFKRYYSWNDGPEDANEGNQGSDSDYGFDDDGDDDGDDD